MEEKIHYAVTKLNQKHHLLAAKTKQYFDILHNPNYKSKFAISSIQHKYVGKDETSSLLTSD